MIILLLIVMIMIIIMIIIIMRDRSIYMIGRFICEFFTNGLTPPPPPPFVNFEIFTTAIFDWSKS